MIFQGDFWCFANAKDSIWVAGAGLNEVSEAPGFQLAPPTPATLM